MLRLKEERTRDQNLIPVVAAKVGLPKGVPLAGDVLETKFIPESLVSRNHIQERLRHQLPGMVPLFNIDRGEVLLWTHFLAPAAATDEATRKLKKGERAVALKVGQVSGVAGLILPGSRVDVFGTFHRESADTQRAEIYTRPLLYGVPVIAVDSMTSLLSIRRDRRLQQEGYSCVTLAVNARAARLLTFAQANGELNLVLRRPEDTDIEPETEAITMENMDAIADMLIQEQRGPDAGPALEEEEEGEHGLGKEPAKD